jgi:hypothetical protein
MTQVTVATQIVTIAASVDVTDAVTVPSHK